MTVNHRYNTFRSFHQSASGAVAIVFSITAVAVLMVAGVALDYGRSITTQTKMQSAADAGVLAAVRAATMNSKLPIGQLKIIAREYYDNNMQSASGLQVDSFALALAGDGYQLEVSASMSTTLMSAAGISTLDIGVSSQAETGPGRPLEIALVLDNTGSMSGAKLTSLKDSANILVDKLLENASDPKSKTKVALVPFANYVNVGMANRNASWISVPDDYTDTTNSCWNTYPDQTGCSSTTTATTCTSDGVPYSCNSTTTQCTSWGDPVQVCQDQTNTYAWQGCVGSRDYPLNVGDDSYNTTNVPGLLNVWCSEPITPLTDDKAVIAAKIDEMSASGSTYIPAGLSWGWRVLSKSHPYNEGKTYNEVKDEGGIKAIVLMTDGANTRSPQYPDHWGSDVTLANTLTQELCTNVKNEDIAVYTIAFEVADTDIKDLLQGCATEPGYYFDAANSAQLSSAFEAIAGQLAQLKLTK